MIANTQNVPDDAYWHPVWETRIELRGTTITAGGYIPMYPATAVYTNFGPSIPDYVSRDRRRALAAIERRKKPFGKKKRIEVDSPKGHLVKQAYKESCMYPEEYPHWWGTEAHHRPSDPPREQARGSHEHLFRRRL